MAGKDITEMATEIVRLLTASKNFIAAVPIPEDEVDFKEAQAIIVEEIIKILPDLPEILR